jgi:hypothetical protein
MSDHFEKAKDDILARTADNGGPSPYDLLLAIEATNTDNDEDHKTIIKKIDDHLVQADIFFLKVTKLEAYREDSEKNCTRRIKALWHEEHLPVHAQHVEEMHKIDEEAYDIKKLYRMVKWGAIVIGGGILLIIADQIGNLIFGGAT